MKKKFTKNILKITTSRPTKRGRELVQLSERADFERLREHVIEGAFEKQTEYKNPDTGTRGETYSKIFGAE